jgi:hypothetical protein
MFARMRSWTTLAGGCLAAGWNILRMPGRSHRGPLPPADDVLRDMAGQLQEHLVAVAERIGERNLVHSPDQLAATADYIESQWRDAGYTTRRQAYDVDGRTCCNLEIEIPGTRRADEIVVVGAHYDSVRGSPAANDNGSGVAAVLTLARRLAGQQGERTLRFVAFVNEEAPYAHTDKMGSWVYAAACRRRNENVTAMLSLETIGCYSDEPGSQKYPALLGTWYPSRGNYIAFVGSTRFAPLVHEVVGAFRRSEAFPSHGGALPDAISHIGRSDHWSFWQEGYPALMVTDTAPFRYRHYHTAEDTVDKIDIERMARVVRGLLGVVKTLAAMDAA